MTISELCEAKDWHRGRFYKRTDAAAESVAAYLNKHECLLSKGNPCRNMDAAQHENSPSVAKVAMK